MEWVAPGTAARARRRRGRARGAEGEGRRGVGLLGAKLFYGQRAAHERRGLVTLHEVRWCVTRLVTLLGVRWCVLHKLTTASTMMPLQHVAPPKIGRAHV